MKKTNDSSKVKTNYLPEGAHALTPYLVVKDAAKFIDFTKKAFNAELTSKTKSDNGLIVNANLNLGDSAIMVCDLMDGMKVENAMLYLYVKDVDAVYKKAIDAGAENLAKVEDQFYGDRAGAVKDTWGNKWWIATHTEDVSDSELEKRAKQATKEVAKKSKSKMETVEA